MVLIQFHLDFNEKVTRVVLIQLHLGFNEKVTRVVHHTTSFRFQ